MPARGYSGFRGWGTLQRSESRRSREFDDLKRPNHGPLIFPVLGPVSAVPSLQNDAAKSLTTSYEWGDPGRPTRSQRLDLSIQTATADEPWSWPELWYNSGADKKAETM